MIGTAEQKIEAIISDVLQREGGAKYTNNPADKGGATRYGIAEVTARAFGYTARMQDLPEATARAIYRKMFVSDPGFDQVLLVDPEVGAKLVDAGVNLSPNRAGQFLQRALNSMNVGGTRYAELTVDGTVGPATRDALKAFIRWRGQLGVNALLKTMNSLQGAYYVGLSEANRSQREFVFGWICNRVEIS